MTEQNVSSTDAAGNNTTEPGAPGFYSCAWFFPNLGRLLHSMNYYDARGWRHSAPAGWTGTDPATLELCSRAPLGWRDVQAGDVKADPFARLTTGLQIELRVDHARTRDQLVALRLLLARATEAVASLGEAAALTLEELASDLEQQHTEVHEALQDSLAED